MSLISCAWMRLNTEAAKLGKAAMICTYPGYEGYCSVHWQTGICPCADEVVD